VGHRRERGLHVSFCAGRQAGGRGPGRHLHRRPSEQHDHPHDARLHSRDGVAAFAARCGVAFAASVATAADATTAFAAASVVTAADATTALAAASVTAALTPARFAARDGVTFDARCGDGVSFGVTARCGGPGRVPPGLLAHRRARCPQAALFLGPDRLPRGLHHRCARAIVRVGLSL